MKKSLLLLAIFFLPWASPLDQSEQGCQNEPEYYATFCDDGNKIDGYWWYGIWIPGYIRNETQFIDLPPLMVGKAVWYAEGVMEAQVEQRGYDAEWFKQGYVDGVAAMSCADIGLDYWINRGVEGWEGPFLVLDCPQTDDQWGIIVGREEVVEVGWATKERWGIDSPINVLVSRVAPSESIHFIPTVLSDWYLPLAEFYPRALIVDLDPRPVYRYPRTWRIDDANWVTYEQPTLADYDWPSESRWLTQLR